MSKEFQEIWEFVQTLKYNEEESIILYDTLTKEGFYTVGKLRDSITSEKDLEKIGVTQFEKRRNIFSTIKKRGFDDDNEDGSSHSELKIDSSLEPVPDLKIIQHNSSGNLKSKDKKKDVRESVENLKKFGSKIGRGAISRLFYALSLVKKRMLEFGLGGSVEAELEVAMFVYNIEVEINNEVNTIEEEVNYLKEIESTDAKKEKEEGDKEVKHKEAKYSFIKKAIAKFLVAFRDHMTVMAEKMNKKNLNGTVGIGVGIGLGPIGSITIKPKIEISTLMEWNSKQRNLNKLRGHGKLIVHLISGKELKKDNVNIVFQIGEEKRESNRLRTHDPKWDETFDALPCAPCGEELSIQLVHKNKNIGKKMFEEVFVNIEKMNFENNVPKQVNLQLITKGSLQVEFTYEFKDIGTTDGELLIEVLEGKKLVKKDITGKSDPYLIFFPGKVKSNKVNTKSKTLIKTKYISQNLNPVWNENLTMKITTVKEGITIFCYDYDLTGDHDFMGKVFLALDDVKPNGVYDRWLDLDTEGKIRIKYQFIPN